MNRRPVLVSRSCTTGWTDWVHGELWLSHGGLVRRRIGLWQTLLNGFGPTVEHPLPERDLDVDVVRDEHRTNLVLGWAEVRSADLRRGLVTSRLRLTTRDGTVHHLLFFRVDPAYAVLKPVIDRL
ncbi:hypothetical protein AB0I60_02860 [Actinosynnema sp. NPDC050436]|uniref:hypothetical protein n=1 Tax=Actinosynnema sp. NPDC050436 TaxID=3155659 RepID=UPI0033C2CB35